LEVYVLTIEGDFLEDINTVLLRLNLLLENGYYMDTEKDVFETVWLSHTYKRELDLILCSDGLIVSRKMMGLNEDNSGEIRIHETEHEKFLEFVEGLPKISLFHKLFSIFFRGGV
jgi:hypothetical protein